MLFYKLNILCQKVYFYIAGERLNNVQEMCRRLKPLMTGDPDYSEIYLDKKRKYIYCLVSKVSCTTWKRTLLSLTDYHLRRTGSFDEMPFGEVHNKGGTDKFLPRMATMKAEERHPIIDSYYKFVFVREPLERLISAYRSKILGEGPYALKDLAKRIVLKYRPANNQTGGW